MLPLLQGWGSLVKQVAASHGGSADGVFDPARILRVPGTTNWKNPQVPVAAWAKADPFGTDVSADALQDALDTYLSDEFATTSSSTSREKADMTDQQVQDAVAAMPIGKPCNCIRKASSKIFDGDDRHPSYLNAIMAIIGAGRRGCPGAAATLKRMRRVFVADVTAPGDNQRSEAKAKAEWNDMLLGAVKIAAVDPQLQGCLNDIPARISDAGSDPDSPKRSELVPAVHPNAYHGVVGEYVKEIAPHTESDPLAVLVQALAWVGCKIGRSAWIRHGNVTHYPLIWPLIVGRTSTGRKGNSAADSLSSLNSLSSPPRMRSGLSSGEGLIEAFMAKKEDDPRPDPRMIVLETEWESVLARTRREGNTLSAVLRDAWDGRTLATMNAGGASREVAVHALTVVGHITPQALKEGMTGTDLTNGFLNRFIPIVVHRPHLVVWPEEMGVNAQSALLTIATKEKEEDGEYTLTSEAKILYADWYTTYSSESEKTTDRVAMATGRAVPNLLRLALIYAWLDDTDNVIGEEHIRAAIAVIDNARASAQLLLAAGRAGVDGKILKALRENGPMTKTELFHHFARHVSADQLNEALTALVDSGEVLVEKNTGTGGRPSEVYRAQAKKANKAN